MSKRPRIIFAGVSGVSRIAVPFERRLRVGMGVALLCFLIAPCVWAQRTQFKAGWNVYSPQEDIQLGKQVAADAEKQLPSCNAPKVDAYLTELGKKLSAKLPAGGSSILSSFIA